MGVGRRRRLQRAIHWLLWEFWWVAWEYWREYGVAARPLRGRPGRGFLVGAADGKRELGAGGGRFGRSGRING